jgi:hypothetical protein
MAFPLLNAPPRPRATEVCVRKELTTIEEDADELIYSFFAFYT